MTTAFERLTGFAPTGRERRFVVLLDYGYGPGKWVVHGTAGTEDRLRRLTRQVSHWPSDKVQVLDQEANERSQSMTMRYKIDLKLNDGKAEAPPYEVEVDSVDQLFEELAIEGSDLTNDYGEPFGVGTTLTITRIN